jgi:hypothetical protein
MDLDAELEPKGLGLDCPKMLGLIRIGDGESLMGEYEQISRSHEQNDRRDDGI